MFNFDWSELALIAVVALVLIGPKDLPVAIKAITDGIKKLRRMAGELQGHVDEMVRDADLGDAREAFRDIRSMNLRSKVMSTLDRDGSIGRTLREKPLADANIMGKQVFTRPTPPNGAAFIPPPVAIAPASTAPAATPAAAFIPPAVAKVPPAPTPTPDAG